MDKLQYSNLLRIKEASKQGRLVVFVGAGVSNNSGVPTWSTLIDAMKQECNLVNEKDDLKIAQLYKDARGEKEYMDKVKNVLKYNKVIPNIIHKDILTLTPCHIITTNYDNLLEQEIENEFKQYAIIKEDRDLPNMLYSNSVTKMHGDFDANIIVLTESDYHNYAKNFPLIRSFVISLFASKLVVFVGFSFADLNLKIILNDVHSVLEDSMQKAYLITDEKPDVLTVKYYQNKGINIVYLDDEDIQSILPLSDYSNINKLTNPKGIYLHRMLNCVRMVKKNPEHDLASMLYAKLKSYKDEIKDLGDGLRYFIPKDELKMWNPHSEGLQLYSPYFRSLSKQLKTFAGKRKFILEHPEIDRQELKRFAYYNYLYRIDDVKILDSDFIYNLEKYFDSLSAPSYIYQMDFKKLNERLKYLSAREYSCNADDLEYPFTLYKLGNYYEAYKIYNKILSNAWKSEKYILYFISLYNIWSIRGLVWYQLAMREDVDADALYKKMCDIDLDDTLRRLPIEEEIRNVFQDLLSYRAIGIRATETEELSDQLHKQRKAGEKGGVSINSNIANLLSKFEREFRFCNDNYIICDNSKQYQTVCLNTVRGILNSYATPAAKFGGLDLETSKIDEIFALCVFAFIFCVENKQLMETFKQYDVGKITLSDDAIEYVNTYLKNLSEAKSIPYADGAKLATYIQNLLFVSSRIKNDTVDVDTLYKVVLKYWNALNLRFSEKCLNAVLSRYQPNAETLTKIANKLMENLDDNGHFSGCFSYIAHYMSKLGMTFNDFDMDIIKKKSNSEDLYYLYNVLDKHVQDDFSEYCQQNLYMVSSYFEFIADFKLKVASEEKFKQMIEKIRLKVNDENAHCCWRLAKIRKDKQNSNIHNIIDEYAAKNECLKFYLSPLEYEDKEKVLPEWLLFVDEETIHKLVKVDEYKNALKKYLKENRFISHRQRMMVVNIL